MNIIMQTFAVTFAPNMFKNMFLNIRHENAKIYKIRPTHYLNCNIYYRKGGKNQVQTYSCKSKNNA
jgi:hypothetical protein